MRTALTLATTAIIATSGLAAAQAPATDLDVTRVALFSSGVGYFECEQSVDGHTRAELSFRTEQINDILKSLVVQDFGGGRIGVVSYPSRDPIEKTLKSFGVDLTDRPTLGQLLNQLRGEPVVITGLRSISGRIVGVETVSVVGTDGLVLEQRERLTVLTEARLERVDLTQIDGIQLLNDKVDGELRKALATLASAHDADKKTVEIDFEGTGSRQVRVAYLLEAPIWKTSYRLVLREDQEPFLQGWATVDNATEEDWNNVQLSLVSGRPISFRMDLYTPLYVPRPLEQLELYASLRPPDYAAGFGDYDADSGGAGVGGRADRGARARKSMAASPARMPAGVAGSDEAFFAREERPAFDLSQGVASVADAREAGELFKYRIATPVSIPRRHSAMLPIVNQAIEATPLSIYNPSTHPKHPLNGLEVKNTTGLNLMQGPVTVFAGDVYAGDAKLPNFQPAEKRLLAYALDLGTEVMVESQDHPDRIIGLKIAKGVLWHQHRYEDRRTYKIKNKDDAPTTVLLEQAYHGGWELLEPDKPYEKTEDTLRFKVEVPASKTVEYPVRLERIASQTVAINNLNTDQIQFYLRARVISAQVKEALQRVVAVRAELDQIVRQRERLETERREGLDEQERIRKNLQTLDRNSDAYRRQLQTFDDVDEQIRKLADQISTARDQEERKRKELEAYLLGLNAE